MKRNCLLSRFYGIFRSIPGMTLVGSIAVNLPLGAQDDDDDDVYGSTVDLSAYEVPGYRSSLAQSAEAKKNASQVLDTITAEEIGQFPDTNVAEAIQRLTGVAMTRNNGEGEKVSVRGLNPNFTRVEVDGRSSMVTVDDSSPERDAQLSVLSSDLYQSIEVIKSPTAADVEGGVGGIVRLKTPDPLDIGYSYGLDANHGWSDFKDDDEFGFSGFYSNSFNDGQIGLLLHATYEELDRRVDKVQSNQDFLILEADQLADDTDPAQLALVGAAYPGRTRYFLRAGDKPRTNLNGKLQIMASPDLELYLNAMYTTEDRYEERARIQMQWSRGRFWGGTVNPETGTLTSAQVDRHRTDIDSFVRDATVETTGITAGLLYDANDWKISSEFSTSDGSEDFLEARIRHRTNRDGLGGWDFRDDPKLPGMMTPAIVDDPANLALRGLDQQHRIIGFDEKYFTFDAERLLDSNFFTSIVAGIRWAETDFKRLQGRSNAPTEDANGDDLTFADADPDFAFGKGEPFGFGMGGPGFPTIWPSGDPLDLLAQYPLTEPITFDDGNVYTVSEEVLAGYLMANFMGDMGAMIARGNIGVRLVRTKTGGVGKVTVSTVDETIVLEDFPSFEDDYSKPLPAFNLVLAPKDDAGYLIRGAITRALTRPTINELRPAAEVNVEDQEISTGNSRLDPFQAWQYDLGVEYYFGEGDEGLFSVAGFIKDVENFITPTEFTETRAFDEAGIPSMEYLVDSYINGGKADIQGIEMSVQTPFTFLPDFWSNFGGMFNYTYIDSEFIDVNGNSNPFPGTSENTFNAVLFYEQGGFSTRFAYNYRDDYLIVPSSAADGSNNEFVEGAGRLDFGLRYRWDSGWKVAVDILNLTEESQYIYYDVKDRLEDHTLEGMIVNVSAGFKY